MKEVRFEIQHCFECPFCIGTVYTKMLEITRCAAKAKIIGATHEVIPDEYSKDMMLIPAWCPLPDVKTP